METKNIAPPVELQAMPQWVVWFYLKRGNDLTKPPCNPCVHPSAPLEKRLAQPNAPKTWGTYRQAIERYTSPPHVYHGIGFMFSSSDRYCGIDLDHCVSDPGTIAPWASDIVGRLKSYAEFSPSGEGIHIFIQGSLQQSIASLGRTKLQHKAGSIEVYDTLRYFTWTGRHVSGLPLSIEPRQETLTELYQEWFPAVEEVTFSLSSDLLPLSRQEIISLASRARGGNGERFTRLWRGDRSDYRDPHTGQIDESRADLALLAMLAYWTQKDPNKMEELFKLSGLYRPNRWIAPARNGETYGSGSIRLAIQNCHRVYDPNWKK